MFNGSQLITSHPRDIVLDGSPVTLSCSGTLNSAIDDPSLLSIMWYHEEMMVQLTNNVSLSNGGAAFTNTLIIDPFTIPSVGDYRCVAMIDGSTAETTTIIRAERKTSIKGYHIHMYTQGQQLWPGLHSIYHTCFVYNYILLYLINIYFYYSSASISQCNSCTRYLHYRRYINISMYCNS